jgi:hypothetical protein
MLSDFLLNLLAEAIGILVTVLIIDRFIKRAESRRWELSKNLLYAKFFKYLENFLFRFYGIGPLVANDLNLQRRFYFGHSLVIGHVYMNIEQEEMTNSLNECIAKLPKAIEKEELLILRTGVNSIIDTSLHLLDHDLAYELSDLEHIIENFVDAPGIRHSPNILHWKPYDLYRIIFTVMSLHTRLEMMASKITTPSQEFAEGLSRLHNGRQNRQ